MTSPADIIRQLLIDQNLGTASGTWRIFTSFLPDGFSSAICVYDTAGKMDGRIMLTGEQIEHPGIQVRVVGPDYPAVWEKTKTIALALDAVFKTSVAISSEEEYVVTNVSRSGAIIPMGIEVEGDRRRHNLTINAMLTYRTQ